jgi:CxxC motif-containing protein (DUF1111 family)
VESDGDVQQALTTHLEAENFTNNSGLGLENCSEGGQNVMDVGNGEWASYPNVDFNGLTQFQMRVASNNYPATVEFRRDTPTGQLYATCNAPFTGGWQTWTTISCNATGAIGVGTLVMKFNGASSGSQLPNVNWIKLVKTDPVGAGATVQAESGIGTGIQLENSNTTVGYFDAGDNIAYANINLTGVTGLNMRVAGETAGGVMQLRADSTTGTLLGSYTMTPTGGWQVYTDRSMTLSTTMTGVHNVYMVGSTGAGIFNIDYFTLMGGGGGANITNGLYELKFAHSNKCLDVSGAGTADGVNVQQYTCNTTNAQRFTVTNLGGNIYELKNFNSNKCAQTAGGGTANNTNIEQYTCNQGTSQKFKFVAATGGTYEVRHELSNRCLDVAGQSTADSANVALYDCLNQANQRVTLVPVAAGTCSDAVQNQGETGVDCGGPCGACATCSDGIKNQGETGVDCGGPCGACAATCSDGIQNQTETGVDCGGPCAACGTVVPLYSASTTLQPVLQTSTASALITNFADRGRDRHAREGVFKSYEHFLSWYWEDRTIEGKITDTIGKGGTTIRLDVKSLQKLSAREGRMFYMGLHTVAEYCDNSPLLPAFADGSPMPMATYDAMNPDQVFYYYKVISNYQAPLSCATSALATGQLIEMEISQFLDTPNNGRSNYYGTTFLYKVGTGFVPWEATGASQNPFLGSDCSGGACGITNNSLAIGASRLLGGATTTHRMESNEGESLFLEMATNMAPVNVQSFMLGRRLLHSSGVDGIHDEKPTENPPHPSMIGKSGPQFVNKSCQSCHERNSRALPPAVGGTLERWVFKVGDANGAPHTKVGKVFQPMGANSEGGVTLGNWTAVGSLRSPTFNFTGSTFNGTPPANFSARVATQMVGLGLLEAIKESDILALADPSDTNADGVSGRAHIVSDTSGVQRLGRFGWKAFQPSLRQQIAGALNTDMGITTSVFPTHDCGSTQTGCGGSSQELSNADLDLLVAYVSLLGVRPQDNYTGNGGTVFTNAGCAKCHTAQFTTSPYAPMAELRSQVIKPYTDLLLHDMGTGLADTLKEGQATVQEWRTPPLWSIGKTAATHAGAEAYLHDGRARTLDEAIMWHGGEGTNAKNAYVALSATDKASLIAFLQSL